MRTRHPAAVPFVKTTVDLPRALLKQAKHHAVQKDTTLKALLIAGLKRQLGGTRDNGALNKS
jgi:hypothetical protein